MRDLTTEEIGHVYGAGSQYSPYPPRCHKEYSKSKSKHYASKSKSKRYASKSKSKDHYCA